MSNGVFGNVPPNDLLSRIEKLERQIGLREIDQDYYNQTEAMRAVWQDHEEENVDATHPLELDIFIPEDCKLIDRAFLRLKLLAFRSYSGTVEAGGSSTPTTTSGGGTTATSASGGGSTATSAAGGDHRHMVFQYEGLDMLATEDTSDAGGHDHSGEVTAESAHHHTYSTVPRSTSFAVMLDPETVTTGGVGLNENWSAVETYDIYTWDSSGNHVHDVTIPAHTHGVTIPNHSHGVTIPDHVHDVEHGIYEGTPADDVTVTINGTDRTVALGGAVTGFTADQDSLDIMQYLQAGWNTIELGSSCLGRIQATYFVKAYLP